MFHAGSSLHLLAVTLFIIFGVCGAPTGQSSNQNDDQIVSTDDWKLNSVVIFERDGKHFSSGCITVLFDVEDNPEIALITAWETFKKIEKKPEGVTARTAENVAILFTQTPLFDIKNHLARLGLAHVEQLEGVHLVGDKAIIVDARTGVAAVWYNGNIVPMYFHVINNEDCGMRIEARYADLFFCAQLTEGNGKIDAGRGSPYFIKMARTQFLAGIQIGYDRATGHNLYAVTGSVLHEFV